MSQTTLEPATAPAQKVKYRTVDADQHLNPPYTFWADYLPARFKDIAPRIEHAEDADYVIFEGNRRKIKLLNSLAGKKAEDFKLEGRLSDTRKGGFEAEARITDMNADGIDVAVMYGGGPLGTGNVDLYIESFKAYNRFVRDFCNYDPKRLYPVGYVPMRDVAESVAFVKELAAQGFTAVNIPAFPQDLENLTSSGAQVHSLTGDPNAAKQYDHPDFDPFWSTVVDLDMAVTFHLGGRATRFADKKFFLSDLLASKFSMAEPVALLLFNGVFDRHPRLRIGTIESGGGWLAFAADYMDRTWEKQRYWVGSEIKHTPSYYLEKNVWASFIHDRVAIENRHLPGAKNIMWSSDYPHSETTFPDSAQWIDRLFKGVPEDEKHLIVSENARQFFRVD